MTYERCEVDRAVLIRHLDDIHDKIDDEPAAATSFPLGTAKAMIRSLQRALRNEQIRDIARDELATAAKVLPLRLVDAQRLINAQQDIERGRIGDVEDVGMAVQDPESPDAG